ncbi:helix-turn-helix domain-containing protein [Gemmatimonadota bacterium DH-20]|uniref:Helix-turn-helix domain-containing protein n=1 Tax=Gaopeijia maritima TaxID=3119007 RepID=A0ABU9EA62_9BACT
MAGFAVQPEPAIDATGGSQMNAVISTTDLAHELGVTPETVARWIREGRFEGAFQRRGRWRIPIAEARAVAEEYASDSDEYDDEDEEDEDGIEEDADEPESEQGSDL